MSWLVRCWEEPRDQPQGDPVLRCFIRDLKTGEERYLSDPRELGDLVTGGRGRQGTAETEPEKLRTGG
ncbi:MAG TPA: hypothetical protein VGH73_21630 [Thermoanaerobaculia bacterium]|jgi:hypothetical protein